jgi:hypothetical protein
VWTNELVGTVLMTRLRSVSLMDQEYASSSAMSSHTCRWRYHVLTSEIIPSETNFCSNCELIMICRPASPAAKQNVSSEIAHTHRIVSCKLEAICPKLDTRKKSIFTHISRRRMNSCTLRVTARWEREGLSVSKTSLQSRHFMCK